jgi:hypothetical protein
MARNSGAGIRTDDGGMHDAREKAGIDDGSIAGLRSNL